MIPTQVHTPALQELMQKRTALAERSGNGAILLGGVEAWWERDTPKILAAESLFHDLSGQHDDLTAELLLRWKTGGFALEWEFPECAGVACVEGKWKRLADGRIVARYTYAEYVACMAAVAEEE